MTGAGVIGFAFAAIFLAFAALLWLAVIGLVLIIRRELGASSTTEGES